MFLPPRLLTSDLLLPTNTRLLVSFWCFFRYGPGFLGIQQFYRSPPGAYQKRDCNRRLPTSTPLHFAIQPCRSMCCRWLYHVRHGLLQDAAAGQRSINARLRTGTELEWRNLTAYKPICISGIDISIHEAWAGIQKWPHNHPQIMSQSP